MKVLASIFILFMSFGLIAQTVDADVETITGPKIQFDEAEFAFGDIYQGDRVTHVFTFVNSGSEPLILSAVKTTCGCTATNWSREPLAPGEKSEITVNFNSTGKMGMQNKVVTITSNATNNPERVKITANVLAKPVDQ